MAGAIKAHSRRGAASEIVGKDVVRRSLDLIGQLASVRRKPWMQIRTWLQGQRRLVAILIDPCEKACAALLRAGGVDEMAGGRNGKRCHSRVRAHEQTTGDGEWLPGDLELVGIE